MKSWGSIIVTNIGSSEQVRNLRGNKVQKILSKDKVQNKIYDLYSIMDIVIIGKKRGQCPS